MGLCLLSSPAFASGGGSGGLLQPNPGLAIWTIITFVVLLIVLRAFAWKPLIESLEKRTQTIEGRIKEAEEKMNEANQVMEEYKKKLESSKQEAMELINEAKKDAEKIRKRLEEEGQENALKIKEQTQREIELATQQAKEDMWKMAIEISTGLAEKIIEKSLSSAEDKKLIEKIVKDYQKN